MEILESYELKEWRDRSLPVLQECVYCHKIFPDKGCGICFECYEKAIQEAYDSCTRMEII